MQMWKNKLQLQEFLNKIWINSLDRWVEIKNIPSDRLLHILSAVWYWFGDKKYKDTQKRLNHPDMGGGDEKNVWLDL